jgi:exodeoxyribonuclease VII large subunit
MVADARAPTPTAAAELVSCLRGALLERWWRSQQEIAALFRARVENARLRWEYVSGRRVLTHPEWMVERRRQDLDELEARLRRAREALLRRWQHRLALAAGKLDAINPLRTLARGYASVTRLPEEMPVLTVGDLAPEAQVRVRLADGAFTARVEAIQPDGQKNGA